MTSHAVQRLGVFGGTFDPPHVAHQALALAALRSLKLDRLLVIPSGQPWQRGTVASGTQRLVMAELAFGRLPNTIVDGRELERAAVTQAPSYSIDTLEQLRQQYGAAADIFLIMGSDQASNFHTWHRWQDVLKLATLAVCQRGHGAAFMFSPLVTAALADLDASVKLIQMPANDASATLVRTQLQQGHTAGQIQHLPASVAQYIAAQRLYTTPQ